MLLAPVVLTLLCLLPGLPLAVLLARSRSARTPFSHVVVDGIVLGLAWYLLLGIVLAHLRELGQAQVLVPTLVVSAAATAANLRPKRAWPGIVNNARGSLLTLYVFIALVVAALTRGEPAYFLYQIGDFGEYVNRGNVLADGGTLGQWFTHGFGVMLALGNVALGEAHTVDVMPFLGIVVMGIAIALASRLGAGDWGKAAVATIFAIGVVPTWFSQFPASETLYAVLQLAMILFLVTALQTRHHATAAVGGALAFLLLLTRGNGLLLAPLLLGTLVVAALLVRRETFAPLVTFTVTGMAGLFAAFVYNSRHSRPYFVDFQLPQFFSDGIVDQLDDLGSVGGAVPKGVLLAAVVALIVWLARLVNGRFGGSDAARRAAIPAVVLVAVAATFWPLDAGGLRDALERYDVVVYLLGALGLGLAIRRFPTPSFSDADRVGVLLVVATGAAFALLHAHRFPAPRYAPYYLYWDRYLWSEFFPLLVVLAGLGVTVVELAWRRLGRDPRTRAVGAAGLTVAGLAAVWTLWSAGDLSRQHRFMGDAYGDMARLADLTGERPIVYAGVERPLVPLPLYFPNTYRLFATPLLETFEKRVLNIDLHPFAHDPRPNLDDVRRLMDESGVDRVALVEVVDPGDGATPGLRTLGTVDVEIPMLDRPVFSEPEGWKIVRIRLAVHEVTR